MHNVSLRSCPYCLGARLKFSQRSHDPKKGLLRRQISLDYYTIPPAIRRLAQCRKEKNGAQRSSLKSTASSNVKHSEVKRFEKRCI